MPKVGIDSDLCRKDGLCTQICPQTLLVQPAAGAVPRMVDEERCFRCGQCAAICPSGALSHGDFSPGSISPIDTEAIPSSDQVVALLRARRSIRAFQDRPVPKELLEQIVQGAGYAPSSHNTQSTGFIVVQDQAILRQIAELTAHYMTGLVKQLDNPVLRRFLLLVAKDDIEVAIQMLPDFRTAANAFQKGDDPFMHGAPVLIVFHGPKSVSFPATNANLALHNATLVANSLGLGCFYVGYVTAACDRDQSIAKLLSVPSGEKIFGALAVGHPRYRFTQWIERKPARLRWV